MMAAWGWSGLMDMREEPMVESVLPLKSPTRTDLAARTGRSPALTICKQAATQSRSSIEQNSVLLMEFDVLGVKESGSH